MKTIISPAKLALLAAASIFAINSVASAGETEDALIAKIVDAYGGDKLTGLETIRINDSYKTAFPGQGYTSGYVEFTHLKQDAKLDLVNERGSVEGWGASWNFTFNNRTVSVDDDIVAINYNADTYQPAASPDYFTAFGAVIRVSDTLLAHQLSKQAENAQHEGEITYIGSPHEMISFEMPQSPRVTLYVEKDTGLISKMARATGFGALSYQFSNHTQASGVTYARDFEFFVGPDINLVSHSRVMTPNRVRNSTFGIERNIMQEPERVDTSEMTVEEVAPGVHHVGTGPGYTAFIDAGDHIIGVGGYALLNDRWEAYKEAAGHDKPLRYQIATHHHTDHLGGIADAFGLGANFVSTAGAVANLNTAAGETIPEDRLMVLDGKMTLGPIEIYDITTSHVDSYALVYIPAAKIAFQADHYGGVYADGPSPAGRGTVTFKAAIDDLDIDVDTVLSAHGRKSIPWSEVEAAVAAYKPGACNSRRPICRDMTN